MKSDKATADLRVQEYLDDISQLDICREYSQWYNVDVSSLLSNTNILGHEIDYDSGTSLIFLDRSVMLCCPQSGKIHHYPKHLLHCFIDDKRGKCHDSDGTIFRAELFSISPTNEQLCWEKCCVSEIDVPQIQYKVAKWIGWLNS
ncbi:MAG: hypothetical protein ACKVI6_05570 [Candidatus Poseidoniales archaeon]|jgi:hypothetical protein|tara:strand:+ start:2519 stop:2953 length:435 start_codon:yes stop_codon:yes gene_type:complete